MATRLRDGFDFYSAVTEAVGVWTSIGNCTISATTRFGVGQSLGLPAVGFVIGQASIQAQLGANCTVVFVNFALRKTAALGTTGARHTIRLIDSGTTQCSFVLDNNGDILFYRGSAATLLGTYSGAFSGSGIWSHFQIKIIFGDGVAGSFEVRKDGSSSNTYSLTGIDNVLSANTYANAIDGILAANNPDAHFFDDFWVFDNTVVAGEPSDWLGDTRAVQIMPNSDSLIALSRSGGATNFSNIDELVNSSADYVFGNAAGLTDEYGNPGFSAPVPTFILGVTEKVAALKTDAGPRTIGTRTRSGATVQDSAAKVLSTAVVNYPFNVDLNPNTAAPWTAAEIAAMTFGPRIVT